MSHLADTPALIYDNLVATTLAGPSRESPMVAAIEKGRTETPLFDSLTAEWTSGRSTPERL